MKIFFTTALVLINTVIMGQTRITGRLVNRENSISDSIILNIPYVYGFHAVNNIYLPVDKNGYFKGEINLSKAEFVKLETGSLSHSMYIEPGKSLDLLIDSKKSKVISFSGSAASYNILLTSLELDQVPFFNKGGDSGNVYSKVSIASISDSVVKPWQNEQTKKLRLIESSSLPADIKKLFSSELRYNGINQLNYFARGIVRMKRDNLIKFIIALNDTVSIEPEVKNPGQQYYLFANNYVGYLEAKAFLNYTEKKLTSKDPLDYYKISMDSGNVVSKEKGKIFLNWLAVKNNFPPAIAEKWLAQAIANAADNKELTPLKALHREMTILFPKSKFLARATESKNQLVELLAKGNQNRNIIILNKYENVKTIQEVINQYKGKVVYVDIWGTWCGPCKEELTFVPELKARFKDRELVFVYLDMDDDQKDKEWKEFIRVNNLSGVHLRKSNTDIQPFWNELLPTQKDRHGFYPSYFIFDKEGKLAVPLAKRPSDKEELYQQLESFLK